MILPMYATSVSFLYWSTMVIKFFNSVSTYNDYKSIWVANKICVRIKYIMKN